MNVSSYNISVPQSSQMLERYRKARAFENLLISGETDLSAFAFPNWLSCGKKFWYTRKNKEHTEYRFVDAVSATNTEAFDHLRLAKELSSAVSEDCHELNLPISIKSYSEKCMTFLAFGRYWKFEFDRGLFEEPCNHENRDWLVSPDQKSAVFVKNYNLWICDLASGRELALTTDGVEHYAYAREPEARDLIFGLDDFNAVPGIPEALWSPDGKKVLTFQLDERRVKSLPSILFAPTEGDVRPKLTERKYALPGDKYVPTYRVITIDVETGVQTAAKYQSLEDSFLWFALVSGNRCWWSADSDKAYFLDMSRGQKSVKVVELTIDGGTCRVLFTEIADSFLEIGHNFEAPTMILPLPETDELIWFSHRSGYAHLYLYDLKTGKLKNPITAGDWTVSNAFYVNKRTREVMVQMMGRVQERNYYYREIANFNLDTGEMTLIASGDFDFHMYNDGGGLGGLSPDGEYLVSTHARVDTPPVTDLRDRSGNLIMKLESANLSRVPEDWGWPEPFEVTAADGETKLYGTMFRPSNFDPEKKYPVLDFGHWNNFSAAPVSHSFNRAGVGYFEIACAFAEIGLIVIMMEGRGKNYQKKSIRDYGYDNFLEIGATRDHVSAIKELSHQHEYLDLERVGILDFDGSNAAIHGLLQFPDFYKVGVSSSLYDPRLVKQGEVYSGIIDETKRNEFVTWDDVIHNLKGKLLIITGLRDKYFHPSATFRLTDALLRANKDFDHVVQPNGSHAYRVLYSRRRIWDYLARHLIGVEPPNDFPMRAGWASPKSAHADTQMMEQPFEEQ